MINKVRLPITRKVLFEKFDKKHVINSYVFNKIDGLEIAFKESEITKGTITKWIYLADRTIKEDKISKVESWKDCIGALIWKNIETNIIFVEYKIWDFLGKNLGLIQEERVNILHDALKHILIFKDNLDICTIERWEI